MNEAIQHAWMCTGTRQAGCTCCWTGTCWVEPVGWTGTVVWRGTVEVESAPASGVCMAPKTGKRKHGNHSGSDSLTCKASFYKPVYQRFKINIAQWFVRNLTAEPEKSCAQKCVISLNSVPMSHLEKSCNQGNKRLDKLCKDKTWWIVTVNWLQVFNVIKYKRASLRVDDFMGK